MGEYLSPAVYMQETSSGVKPIEGVGTSTGAFVGFAEKGPIDKAILITNWSQFVKMFGGFTTSYLAYAVYGFFYEGGSKCYVVRTCAHTITSTATSINALSSVGYLYDTAETPAKSMQVKATSEGAWGNNIKVNVLKATNTQGGFKLQILLKNNEVEVFDDLELTTVEAKINGISEYIKVAKDGWLESGTSVAGSKVAPWIEKNTTDNPPKKINQSITLAGGNDALPTSINSADYIGTVDNRVGLHAFDEVDDINIVAIPDAVGTEAIMKAGFTYCENRKDCFFIADAPMGKTPQEILKVKMDNYNTTFGALYYPWIWISDPADTKGGKKLLPPSGTVAGIYSNTDVKRGVHKAPAGVSEGYVKIALALEKNITKGEHDILNNPGINVIRFFPGLGICVWGARTLSADAEWKYINIRRLFLYVEESILKATQWVVFEPNDPVLWGKVKRNITAFLLGVWRDGALFGLNADEAFFVKVDAENNPPDVRDKGQLIIDIGIAPVKPAEFVIIRISQKVLTK